MITESKIQLLESLASRVGKFEKTAPQWDLFKMSLSASASWTLFSLGCIITIVFDDYAKLLTPIAFALYSFFGIGVIGILVSLYMISTEKKLKINIYDSHIEEIIEILQKLKQHLERNNNHTK